jgi:hypothetical protein
MTLLFLSICVTTRAADPPAPSLVGSWERSGHVVVYRDDGTGTNHDGSRFRWELKGPLLIARALSADGQEGESTSIPIAFAHDGKEYTISLEGGDLKVVWHKLTPDGRRYRNRTKADRAYPPVEEETDEGPDAPRPSVAPR